MISYDISRHENGTSTVTAFVNGTPQVANDTHPNFQEICAFLVTGETDEQVLHGLFDIPFAIGQKFDKLSPRVSISNKKIYFDGEVIHSTLAEQIVRFIEEGADFAPWVKFLEKIAINPSENSKAQLFDWLQAQGDFTVDSEGNIIGYKGLDANFQSIHSGPAIVNGVFMNGKIPNEVGNVIQMPRQDVADNPSEACSVGLHVGTWGYASSFGSGPTVKVRVNPTNVVSVPSDSGGAKMRVCEYEVLEQTAAPIREALYREDLAEGAGYDEYDEDDWLEDAVVDDLYQDDLIQEAEDADDAISRLRRFLRRGKQ